ncbi:MAG: DUF4176 domain-containing protein [Firmicutes bacterium]|nr:DUF4176 domain-containing protein [Bacillota bacterium]
MKQYLPIGSVVLLKNGKKKVMIYGRRQRRVVDVDKEYDYLACLYPEGNIDEDYMYLFDEDSIDQVVFRGYSDDEEDAFVQALNEVE